MQQVRHDPEVSAGAELLLTGLNMRTWIARRSETIEILDARAGRRTVKVDADVSRLPRYPQDSTMRMVPLAVLDRHRSHYNFDVLDHSGSMLVRVNRTDERRLVYKGYRELVQSALGFTLSDESCKQLWELVHGAGTHAQLSDPFGEFDAIAADPFLYQALQDLERIYFLLVLVPHDGEHHHKVFQYQFSCPLQEVEPVAGQSNSSAAPAGTPGSGGPTGSTGDRIRRILRAIQSGTVSRDFSCDVSGLSDCQSYHVSILAPLELQIGTSMLTGNVRTGTNNVEPFRSFDHDRLGVEGHVFTQVGNAARDATFSTSVYLQPHGVVRAALWSVLFTFAALTGGFVLLLAGQNGATPFEPSSGTTLLLLVPGIIAGVVARPMPSAFMTTVASPTQMILGLSAMTSFAAAMTVSAQWKGVGNIAAWVALVALSVYCVVCVVQQYKAAVKLARTPPPPNPHSNATQERQTNAPQ